MIGISFKSWAFSKFYEIFGGYMIAKRYYYKNKWTPIIFFRWKSYKTFKVPNQDKITWKEVKEICTNLDNIFYGSMFLAMIGILHWFWMLMGIWLIAAPIIYVLICYIGFYIKLYIKNYGHNSRRNEAEADSIPGSFVRKIP